MDTYIKVMKKPQGVVQLPMSDAYYEYHKMPNPNHVGGANPGEDFAI